MKFLSKISKAIGKDDGEDFDQEEVELEADGDLEVNDSDEDGGIAKGLRKLFRRSKADDGSKDSTWLTIETNPLRPMMNRLGQRVASGGRGRRPARCLRQCSATRWVPRGGEGRGSPNCPNLRTIPRPNPGGGGSGSDTNDVGPAGGTVDVQIPYWAELEVQPQGVAERSRGDNLPSTQSTRFW